MSAYKPGTIIYKCRMCGNLEKSTHVPKAYIGLLDGIYKINSFLPSAISVKMLSAHRCPPNPLDLDFPPNSVKFGILDLIGAVEDNA